MVYTRRRGTALVDTPKGILLVRERDNSYSLPGGGANPNESTEEAAIRELHEETGLRAGSSKFLFEHLGRVRKSARGGLYRDLHNVFLISADGAPRARKEVVGIAYYADSEWELEPTTREIIERYRAGEWGTSGESSLTHPRGSDRPPKDGHRHASSSRIGYGR